MKIGKYEIEEEIGHGAMGVVYRARDTLLDRHVAVKVISTHSLDDWSRTLFEREAKAVARMSHPNIIVVHDFDYFEKQPYIVMELLKGKGLEELAQSHLQLLPTLEYVYQVLNGLEHAHEQGVIHRDIKPTNIFVTDSRVVKIMDFGIARLAASASTATQGFVLGTPEYMSPEQVKAESLDGRTDLFSVGTMLYWLLSDETPFSSETANTTMYKVVNEEPPPLQLSGLTPRVHEALQNILNRALAKDPNDRYSSAADMAKEVKKLILLLEHEPVLSVEDFDLEKAETVQVPIKKFSTVRKAVHPEPSVRVPPVTSSPVEMPSDSQIAAEDSAPAEVERTMLLQGSKPKTGMTPRTGIHVPPTEAIRRFSKRNVSIALILLLAAGWGVYRVMVAHMIPEKTPMVPAVPIVKLKLACSREKVRWAKHFIDRFSQTAAGKNVRFNLSPELSAFAQANIFSKDKGYQIWWPSSELEATLLDQNQKQILTSEHKQVALTPMVFVIWKERYDALVSKYKTVSFGTIARALQQESGWKAIAGKPDWGRFTFGFSDAGVTNSGTVMLLLMTHEYLNKDSALAMADVQDPGLKDFLTTIKKKGKKLDTSTTDLIEEMIRKGPGSLDMAFVYENLAIDYLKDAQNRWGDFQIIYPTYNYWNENPLYVLNTSWVSPQQKKTADVFCNFLLGADVQKDSIEHGFRPALTSVPVRVEGSPLLLHQDLGFRVDVGAEIEESQPEVVKALLDLWNQL